jgi:hypothetical protein
MLTSILGTRLSWHLANGWVFEPAIVGPDVVEYTLKEGPHAGRHAIQHGTVNLSNPRAIFAGSRP